MSFQLVKLNWQICKNWRIRKMKKIVFAIFATIPFAIFADFWKELDKVVNVLEELAAPTISNICFSADVINGKPTQISSSFPKNTKKIHVWLNIYGLGEGQSVSSVWSREQNGQFVKIYELSKLGPTDKSQSYMDFSLAVPESSFWPVGQYKVDLVWNNKIIGSSKFQITDSISGGEGIWQGESGFETNINHGKIPESSTSPLSVIEQADTAILTDDEKYKIKNLTEQDILLMVGNKIHGLQSELRSLEYKYRNDPTQKIEAARREYTERINQTKRWGNAALAIKGLPPHWQIDMPQNNSQPVRNIQKQEEKKQENFDFSF